jgi:hypothetical protein
MLFLRERGKERRDQLLMVRHDFIKQVTPLFREGETLDSALSTAFQEMDLLQLVNHVADISLCHKQAISELLLRQTLMGTNVNKQVKRSKTDVPLTQMLSYGMDDLIIDTG